MFTVSFNNNGKIYMIKDAAEKYLFDEQNNLKETPEEKYICLIQKTEQNYGNKHYFSTWLTPYDDGCAINSKCISENEISKYDHILTNDEQIILSIPMKTGNFATEYVSGGFNSDDFYFDSSVFSKEFLEEHTVYEEIKKENPLAFEVDMKKLLEMYSEEILENISGFYVKAFDWSNTKFSKY